MTPSIDQKTRVVLPLVSVMALVVTVWGGAWTMRGINADIKIELREQAVITSTKLEIMNSKLEDISKRVQSLQGDHSDFITTSELRSYFNQLEALNSSSGLRSPDVE